MAFVSKLGNILKQNVSKTTSISRPSMLQAIRCMSSSKLFIGGLSYNTDNQSLGEAFASFGDVHEARVIVDRDSGRSRGFGFVTFGSEEEATRAMSAMDGKDLHGRMVRVNYANDRTGGFRSGGGGGYDGGYGGGGGYQSGGGYQTGGGGYQTGGGGYQTGGGGHQTGGGGYQTGGYNNNVESGGYTGGDRSSGYPPGGAFDVAPTIGGDNFVGGSSNGYAPPSSGYAPPSGGGEFGEPSVSGGYGPDDPLGGDDEPADFADRRG